MRHADWIVVAASFSQSISMYLSLATLPRRIAWHRMA